MISALLWKDCRSNRLVLILGGLLLAGPLLIGASIRLYFQWRWQEVGATTSASESTEVPAITAEWPSRTSLIRYLIARIRDIGRNGAQTRLLVVQHSDAAADRDHLAYQTTAP